MNDRYDFYLGQGTGTPVVVPKVQSDGEWVRYSDYAALEAKYAQLAFLWIENANVARASANVAKENERLRKAIHEALLDIETESVLAGHSRLRAALEEGGDR